MKQWTFYDLATGAVLERSYSGAAEFLDANTPTGCGVIGGEYTPACGRVQLDNAVAVFVPYDADTRARYAAGAGRVGFAWDVAALDWRDTRTLEQSQADAWARIKAARAAAIDGGFEHDGRTYDTDPTSRANIAGAAQGAAIAAANGTPWSVTWTLADNTALALDGPQTVALGLALLAHVDAQHARARDLRARIEAAASNAEADAVAWTAAP